jgi:hypothetical protein
MKPDFEQGPPFKTVWCGASFRDSAPHPLPAAVFSSRVMANTRVSPARIEAAPTKPNAAGKPCAIVADPNAAPSVNPANMNEALSQNPTDASSTPATPMSRACCAWK